MKLTKIFLFFIFALFLLTFSACSKPNNNLSTGDQNAGVSGQVTQEVNDLGNEINQTQQLSDDLASPDLDLDINF